MTYTIAEITCAICNDEWVDAYPRNVRKSECPTCGYVVTLPQSP